MKVLKKTCQRFDAGFLRINWLESVGGELENNAGNWSSDLEMPKAFFGDWDDDEGLVISHNDNPFYFIASVPAYNYGCDGADWIVLLYEPISKIVLFTFDANTNI